MYQSNSHGATSRGALLAVLQSFLLLAVLVLTPVSAIALEDDVAAGHTTAATEPAAEPQAAQAPEQPGPTGQKQASKSADEPAQKVEPKAEAGPAVAEPDLKLRLYPKKVKLFPGGKKVVSAWTCPADVGASFGPDKKPGTDDDDCTPVRAKWSVEQADSARLSNAFGFKTRITLLDDSDIDVRATAEGLTGKGRVVAKEEPAKVRPQAATIEPSAAESTLDASVVDEPVIDEPKSEPAEEPVVDEPMVAARVIEPAEEPVVDEPAAEPSEEPSSEPTEEPVVEEPMVAARIIEPAAIEPAAVEIAATSGAADLDQCANGTSGSSTVCTEWVNGNLNQSKARYNEGDVVPYRMKLSGLPTGGEVNKLTIEWDTTKSSLHALDYITSYDVTVSNANPCAGVSGCTGSPDDAIAIPFDGQVTGAGVTPIAGSFSIWGGDFTSVGTYFYSVGTGFNGDKKAGITVYFTADVANPVIAWGGHIASRFDWGPGQAAGTITGSPYHMRLIDINGKGGNQDRSLSASAVFLESRIEIVKQATPADDTRFDFSTTGGLSPATFSLSDPSSDSRQFSGIFDYGTFTVTEAAALGWDLSFDAPVCSVIDGNGGSQTASNRTITINLKEGEFVSCTFNNKLQKGTLIVEKVVVNDHGGDAIATDFAFDVAGPSAQGPVPFAQVGTDELKGKNTLTVDAGTYTVTESQPIVSGYSVSYDNCSNVVVAAGATQTCTITNDDDPAGLYLKKTVINDNGGSAKASAWTLSAGSNSVTGSAAGALATSVAGTYALSESGPAGYTNTSLTCDNSVGQVSSVTVGLGQTVTCEFVNDDDPATLTLVKVVSGGSATSDDFDPYIDTQLVTWGTPIDLAPGSYMASEVMNVSDYVAGEWGGDCDAQGNVTIALGDALTCAITNYYAELEIEKSADPGFYAAAGDLISYTITATNSGMATLANVDISDALVDGLASWECTPEIPATLAPGASITCTASYEITAADVQAGSVPNTACASSDETSQPVCDDETVYLSELVIEKSADVDYFTAAGDQISYTVTATNTGEFTLTNVDISDALIDGLDSWVCTPTLVVAELASGESITCTATYEVTGADVEAGSVPNSACAVSDQTPEVCDDLDIPLAQLEIEKTANPLTYSAVGDEIVYTITATNTGVATLTDVDISDALIDGLASWECTVGNAATSLPVAQLASGQVITCSATYSVTEADVTGTDPEGFITNVACAVSDQTPEVCDQVTTREIVVELVKSVTPAVLPEPGGVFTFTLFIDNESAVPVTILSLIDDNSALSADWDANCAILVGTTLAPDGPGDADSVTCSYTVERTDAGIYPNTAQVTVVDSIGTQATAQDDESVEVTDVLPQIVVTKTASTGYVEAPGADVDFTFVVENLSVEPVTITSLSDDVFGTLDGDADCQFGTVLGVGASCAFTQTFFVSGVGGELHVNVFTATAEDDEGNQATDDDDAEIVIQTPLEIVIQKTPSLGGVLSGGEVTFTFTFSHPLPFSLYLTSLADDVFGDLLDENNLGPQGDPNVELVAGSNTCSNQDVGFELLAGATYTCELKAIISGPRGFEHRNVVTITATDIDPTVDPEPGAPEPRFTTWSDDAVVAVSAIAPRTPDPRTPDPSQPPTDMLLLTDTSGDGQSGGLFGDPISWAIWVMLSALLIITTGFVLRRQRFAEAGYR